MNFAHLRPKILKYHRWIGLFVGLFVLIQGLTGSLIAFRYELNRALHPAAMIVPAGETPAPLASLIGAAQKALPGYKVVRVDYPRRPDDAFIARLTGKAGDLAIATLDPAGHVTRAALLVGWPVELAYQWHTGFYYGGEPMMGYVALAVLAMAATGLFVWWPRGSRLRPAFKADLKNSRKTRGLHRLVGSTLSVLLIVMAFTGMTMAWEAWVSPVLGVILPMAPDETPAPPKTLCIKPAIIDRDVAAARTARPGETIKSVRLQAKGRIVAVYFQSPISFPTRVTDHVWLDSCNARVLAVEDQGNARAGDWFFNWLLPIHSGDWLGLPGRLLSWIAALTLMVMSLTGYLLWIARTGQRRTGAKRR